MFVIAQLGTLGGPEMIVLVLIVVVLIFGAKKIPELARGIGRASGEFRRGREELNQEIAEMKDSDGKVIPHETDSLINAAKALGIETDGKTDEELRTEIEAAMKK